MNLTLLDGLKPELSQLFQDMMNEQNLQRFCLKALIKNKNSCQKIHLVKALSFVYLIATFYFEMINHIKENIIPSCTIRLMHVYLLYITYILCII